MISETVVELSRAQFALNAVQYFLFVPLTLGLSLLLAGMETWFLLSGNAVYRQMTQFWGKFFAVGFALSVASGLAMTCQFGSNWSYFSHYVGDIFALPLLLGLAGLFIAANGIGWLLSGRARLGNAAHLVVTWLIAIGCHLSLYGFLMASGWMQNPLGADLNAQTLRMELTDLHPVFSNPLGLAKFGHSLLASYAVAAGFVLAISAYYLLKQRETQLAQFSYRAAAALGLLAVAAAIAFGDPSVYGTGVVQRAKLAAINGLPVDDVFEQNRRHIEIGKQAYALLLELRDEKTDPQLLSDFAAAKVDLGYALLLKRWQENVEDAGQAQVEKAARASLPKPVPLLWGYKLMIAVGGAMLIFFFAAAVTSVCGWHKRWLLKAGLYAWPLPLLAGASGWFISETGRQPWLAAGILPSWQGVSTLTATDLTVGLIAYGLAYAGLVLLAVRLTLKFIGQGSAVAMPIGEEQSHVA
ncbi:cytochrome ubiquinol oxidase subunit I [Methylomonas sp. 2BW1-5-20]|uniref:cytochrome ubiquinol oxidase subunit I n=1 Tax=Methylomonas sp. 2BW1-5-20 TaxID=3376686 RepID=UPI0040502EC4